MPPIPKENYISLSSKHTADNLSHTLVASRTLPLQMFRASLKQLMWIARVCVCACARQPRTQAFINSENLRAFFQVSSGKDVHAGLIRHMFQTRRCQNITLLQSVGYATRKTESQLARFTAFDNQAHSSWARLAPLTNRCCADQGGPYKTQPCVNQCEP